MSTTSSFPRRADRCHHDHRRAFRAVVVALLFTALMVASGGGAMFSTRGVDRTTGSSWIAAAFPVGQAGFAHAANAP